MAEADRDAHRLRLGLHRGVRAYQRTGTEPINDRLSMLRAQYVQQRLLADAPVLSRRTTAVGKGWRENIIGLGTDDARDALDRRVEFKVIDCPV